MRDSMIFYRSFFEAIDELEPLIQVEVYKAIFEYSMNGTEVELNGFAKTVWKLIKPQLDANLKRFDNGKKGGRKKQDETKSEPKANQKLTKSEANNNNNVNYNVNNNHNNKIYYDFNFLNLVESNIKIEVSQFEKLCSEFTQEVSEIAVKYLSDYKIEKSYKTKSDYLTIRRWVIEAVNKNKTVKNGKSNTSTTSSNRPTTVGGIPVNEVNDFLSMFARGNIQPDGNGEQGI